MPKPQYDNRVVILDGNGNPFGATNPLPTAAGDTGPTLAASKGQTYIYSTGYMSLTVAGNVRAVMSNPAASTKSVYIARLNGMGTAAAFAELFENPTTGVPTATKTPLNGIVGGGVAASGTFVADNNTTTALGGGTDTGISIGIPNGNRFTIDFALPIILTPGVSLGVNIPFTGAANAELAIYTYEL